MKYQFASKPDQEDYVRLALHLETAPQDGVHPLLRNNRGQIGNRLRRMGEEPELTAHRSAYHALRLFIR